VTPDRPLELMRQAVIRDGHRCSICGRPCSEQEARRHSEPGAFGDSSMNFAAMCYGCQTWLAHGGAKPAQYITHIYDRSEARRRLHKAIDNGMVVLVIGAYLSFAAFAVVVIYSTPINTFATLGSGLLIFFLIAIGNAVLDGFMDRRRNAPIVRPVHRQFGEQTAHLDNQR
jgi:hypothetical protein